MSHCSHAMTTVGTDNALHIVGLQASKLNKGKVQSSCVDTEVLLAYEEHTNCITPTLLGMYMYTVHVHIYCHVAFLPANQ